jgi:hypothetical protein
MKTSGTHRIQAGLVAPFVAATAMLGLSPELSSSAVKETAFSVNPEDLALNMLVN